MLISNKRRFQDRQLDNRRLPRRWRTDPLSFLLWERFAKGNKGIGDLSSVFVFFFIPLSRDKYAFLAPFSPNSQETQRQICHYRMVSQAHHPWKESIGESKLVPSPPSPPPPPTQLTTKKKEKMKSLIQWTQSTVVYKFAVRIRLRLVGIKRGAPSGPTFRTPFCTPLFPGPFS